MIYARNLLTGVSWVREKTVPKFVGESRLSVQTYSLNCGSRERGQRVVENVRAYNPKTNKHRQKN